MFRFLRIEDFNLKGKTIGLRVDINSPVKNSLIMSNPRIDAAAKTIEKLIEMEAKIVILAHQGRKGRDDCISLKFHTEKLRKLISSKIDFIPEIFSENVEDKIKNLKNGNVLILENLRFFDDEKNPNKKDNIILKLERLFDFYVFDSFSVAHRAQTSVVGFKKIPNLAGPLMEKEISGLNKILETKRPHAFVFGGEKPDDLIVLIENALIKKKIDLIFLTGIIGEIALINKGYYFGCKYKFLEEKGFLSISKKLKELTDKYPDKFFIPKDVAIFDGKKRIEILVEDLENNKTLIDKFLIQDIGEKTIEFYKLFLNKCNSIYLKGPAGNFEKKGYDFGTREIFKIITNSKAFSFMGGGHSVTSAKEFGFLDKFSYFSLAGGALVSFLAGNLLPGVDMLEKSFLKFEREFRDFIVFGSNTQDFEVINPKKFSEINLGDKIQIENNFRKTIGGGGINVSVCISRLCGKVGFLSKFSSENIKDIENIANKNKFDLIYNKSSKMSSAKSFIINSDEDRIIFTYRGQNNFLKENDFNFDKLNVKNFYFNSLGGESLNTLIKLALKLKKKPCTICYNPSSYLIETEKVKVLNLIKKIDILILNLEEGIKLTGIEKISEILKKLYSFNPKIVIITNGALGVYLYNGKKEYFQKAINSKKILDTTGAGDCFAGTFFYFYVKHFSIRDCLYYGIMNASSLISRRGSHEGLLYYDDLIELKKGNK